MTTNEKNERLAKKRSQEGKMSVGVGLVLINSILSSLSMFMLFFFEIPKGVLKRLDYFISQFFWQSDDHKKKI